MRKWFSRLAFIAGISFMLYPIISSFFIQSRQSDAIATYESGVTSTDNNEKEEILKNAHEYNNMLFQTKGAIVDNSNTGILSKENYEKLLNASDTGVMGSIEIPKIDVDLPIYHGTSDDVLSSGVGHLDNTSLPVGGENTHCMLSGHRGLPGAKLFTRLDEIEKSDLFFLNIYGEILAYKVNNITIVDPDDTKSMTIEKGRDIVSLVTCTPYGLNTHRLIVTGERVPYEKKEYESIQSAIPSFRELLFVMLPFVIILIAIVLKIKDWRSKKL